MLKFVSLCLETQTDTTLCVLVRHFTAKHVESLTKENGANWLGSHMVGVSKHALSQSFVFIGKLLHDL
jgi:hypothetical protein